MTYEIRVSASAIDFLATLDKKNAKLISDRIDKLAANPKPH